MLQSWSETAPLLVDVAMGRKPADLVIRNGRWVNVYSGEIVSNTDVAVAAGRFAYVGPDAGYMIALSRDFSEYHSVALPHNDEAAAYNSRMKTEHRPGYNWIRNSIATDDKGGIYVAANGWMEKVVWTGHELSADPASLHLFDPKSGDRIG